MEDNLKESILYVTRQRLKQVEGNYNPVSQRVYRFVATFESAYGADMLEAQAKKTEELAQRISGINLEQLPHGVRLFFPAAHADGAEPWTKADILKRSSPWFKDLLNSDFAESAPRRSKRARRTSTPEVTASTTAKDFVDSDDESHEFLFSKRPPQLDSSSAPDDLSYCQVNITQNAYSTYQALLVFLSTGFIRLAPLSSSFATPSPASSTPAASNPKSRLDFISSAYEANPDLPLPVSPKSLYRLAHLLSLDDLRTRALDSFKADVSLDNVATELFTDTSVAYDEMRAVLLAFVKENWAKVKVTQNWKDAMASFREGEMKEASAVMAEVLITVA